MVTRFCVGDVSTMSSSTACVVGVVGKKSTCKSAQELKARTDFK